MSSTRATAFTRTTSAIGASLAVATDPALLGSASEQQRRQLTILLRNALEKLSPTPDPTPDPVVEELGTWATTVARVLETPDPEPETPPRYVVIDHPEQAERWAVKDTVEREYEVYAYRTRGMAEDWARMFNGDPTRGGFFDYGWAPLPGEPEPVPVSPRYETLHARDGRVYLVDRQEGRSSQWYEDPEADWVKETTERANAGELDAGTMLVGFEAGIPKPRFEAVDGGTFHTTGVVDHVEQRLAIFHPFSTGSAERVAPRLSAGESEEEAWGHSLVWAGDYAKATRPRFEVVTLPGWGYLGIVDHEERRSAGFYNVTDPDERMGRGATVRELVAQLNTGEKLSLLWDDSRYSDNLTVVPAP